MQLVLTRQFEIDDATIGTLTIDGAFQCHTLEDVQRATKIRGKTAIPIGTYTVELTHSPRFSANYEKRGLGSKMPLLIDVPQFSGVRIHIGNSAKDTDGCILVGDWNRKTKAAKISGSTPAYKALHKLLSDANDRIRIAIVNEVARPDAKLAHPSSMLFFSFNRNICIPP